MIDEVSKEPELRDSALILGLFDFQQMVTVPMVKSFFILTQFHWTFSNERYGKTFSFKTFGLSVARIRP